jgi:hypothetical protein
MSINIQEAIEYVVKTVRETVECKKFIFLVLMPMAHQMKRVI